MSPHPGPNTSPHTSELRGPGGSGAMLLYNASFLIQLSRQHAFSKHTGGFSCPLATPQAIHSRPGQIISIPNILSYRKERNVYSLLWEVGEGTSLTFDVYAAWPGLLRAVPQALMSFRSVWVLTWQNLKSYLNRKLAVLFRAL